MNNYLEGMAAACLQHNKESRFVFPTIIIGTNNIVGVSNESSRANASSEPAEAKDPHKTGSSHSRAPALTRKDSAPVADFKKELETEKKHADEDTNIHWPDQSPPASARRTLSLRRTSALTMDLTDSIINFRDLDGSYASECSHCNLQRDHRCSCQRVKREV